MRGRAFGWSFFFQAEEGIRDLIVTGVQTCALPISLAGGEPNADVALVAAQLARLAYFAGERERAVEAVEVALDMAEALRLPEVLAEALTTKAMVGWQRPHEAEALLHEADRVAVANDLPAAALRAQFNLSGLSIEHSRFREAR